MALDLHPYAGMALPKQPAISGSNGQQDSDYQHQKAERAWLHTLRFIWRNYKREYQTIAFVMAGKIDLLDSHEGMLFVRWTSEPTPIEAFALAYGWQLVGEVEMNVRHEVRSPAHECF